MKYSDVAAPSRHPGLHFFHDMNGTERVKKIYLNASRPSEHPTRGGGKSKRLGGIIGCKDKTSSWHLNGFPYGSNIGSTV